MHSLNTSIQKKAYSEHGERIRKYVLQVKQLYKVFNKEAAVMASAVGYDGSDPFRWADYPQTARAVKELQKAWVQSLGAIIYSGTSAEWAKSNEMCDALAVGALRTYRAQERGVDVEKYFQPNNDAYRAFMERRTNGMNLSDRIWQQSDDYKKALEETISVAIEKGRSAVTLSKQISQYMNDFELFRREYKQMYGTATDVRNCQYESARLARTEINMAYRTAEQTRWAQLDFVRGYKVCISGGKDDPERLKAKGKRVHMADMCDALQGVYPKSFHFVGWHPQCMCYAVPILQDEDDFFAVNEDGTDVDSKPITDVPDGFKKWVSDNSERIASAQSRGTLPYFLRENMGYANGIPTQLKGGYAGTKQGRKVTNDALAEYANAPTIVLSETQEQQIKQLAEDLRVNYKGVMSFDEANHRRANKHHDTENCQCAVAIHEARLRGLNVTAVQYSDNEDSIQYRLGERFQDVWLTEKNKVPGITVLSKGTYEEKLKKLEETISKGGRWHVGYNKYLNEGHVFTAEKLPSGKIAFYDPQSGDFINLTEETGILSFELLRVDKLLFNTDILKQILEVVK